MDGEIEDANSFFAWVDSQIKRLDIEIERLTGEPRCGYLCDLCPDLHHAAIWRARELNLTHIVKLLGVAPEGYACVPRALGVTLYEEFRGTLIEVRKALQGLPPGNFVPVPLQSAILKALDNRALNRDQLAAKVCAGDSSRLYKPGGLRELREEGLVDHKRSLGYFRPDRPPAN